MMSTIRKHAVRFLALPLLASVAFAPVAAKAATDTVPPELHDYLTQPEQQQPLMRVMHDQWALSVPYCPNPVFKGMNISVMELPTGYDDKGEPLNGEWRLAGHFSGCGQKRVFNVVYLYKGEGNNQRLSMLPGTSHANVRLEHEGQPYAKSAMAKIAGPNCTDIQTIDTVFKAYDPDLVDTRGQHAWTEEWTERACGPVGIVTMHFTPDGPGTLIRTSPDETRRPSEQQASMSMKKN